MASAPDIARLYDDHAPALFAFLLNLLRNEADTFDVMQDLFIKLGRRPGLLEGVRDERGFLLRLAHNAAIDLIRRQRRARKELRPARPRTDFALRKKSRLRRTNLPRKTGRGPRRTSPRPARRRPFETLGKAHLRGHCRNLGNPPQHRRQPLPLRIRQIARPAASPL